MGQRVWRRDETEPSLAPLEPLKKKITVINGLFNKPAVGMGIHPGQTGNLLSGVPIQKGPIVRSGITIDQVLANRVGQETPQSSIVLACEQPMTGYHETNFSMAYSSHISWQSADSPAPTRLSVPGVRQPVREPRQPAQPEHSRPGEGIAPRASSREVSASDRAKLDEYLTSVREVEKRIERMRGKDKAEERAHEAAVRSFRWTGRRTACRRTFASTRG